MGQVKRALFDMVVYMVHPLLSIVLHLMVETMNIFSEDSILSGLMSEMK